MISACENLINLQQEEWPVFKMSEFGSFNINCLFLNAKDYHTYHTIHSTQSAFYYSFCS